MSKRALERHSWPVIMTSNHAKSQHPLAIRGDNRTSLAATADLALGSCWCHFTFYTTCSHATVTVIGSLLNEYPLPRYFLYLRVHLFIQPRTRFHCAIEYTLYRPQRTKLCLFISIYHPSYRPAAWVTDQKYPP